MRYLCLFAASVLPALALAGRAGAQVVLPPENVTPPASSGVIVGSTRMAPAYQVEVMRSWMDTVDRFVRLSQDPVASGVAGVITTVDLLRPQGPEVTIEYLNRLMRETQNATVRRAIRLELIEMYKATNQRDKALDVLHELIVTVPGDGSPDPRSMVAPSAPLRAPKATLRELRVPPPPIPDEANR